jgi:hypothetical protein
MKKWRKVISLTALIAFCCIILTSVILYIVPAGRVAYWSDWHLWGMSKTEWTNIHVNLGVLFLITMILHVYLNWSPVVSYLKTKARELRVFTKDFNAALIITIIFIAGTYWMVPPFSTIVNFSEAFKDAGSKKYGEPPYGHAELSSLKLFVKRMGWDFDEASEKLKTAGIQADDPGAPLKDIARYNNLTPQKVFLAMKPAEDNEQPEAMPKEHPSGLGKMLLSDFCLNYRLEITDIVSALKNKNINAQGDMTLKDIAEQHHMAPSDLYYMIKEIASGIPQR